MKKEELQKKITETIENWMRENQEKKEKDFEKILYSLREIVQGELMPQLPNEQNGYKFISVEDQGKSLMKKWKKQEQSLQAQVPYINNKEKEKFLREAQEELNKFKTRLGMAPLSNSKLRKFYQSILKIENLKEVSRKKQQLLYLMVHASYEAGRERGKAGLPYEVELLLKLVNQSVTITSEEIKIREENFKKVKEKVTEELEKLKNQLERTEKEEEQKELKQRIKEEEKKVKEAEKKLLLCFKNFQEFWEAVLAFHREVESEGDKIKKEIEKDFNDLRKKLSKK